MSADQHLGKPGLVVLDITAADEATARAVVDAFDRLWAVSGAAPGRRVRGGPGVRVRVRLYADVRRRPEAGEPSWASAGFRVPGGGQKAPSLDAQCGGRLR